MCIYWYSKHRFDWVSNFDECAASRFPIEDRYPARCVLPNSKYFTQDVIVDKGMKSLPFRVLLTGTDIPTLNNTRPDESYTFLFSEKDTFQEFLTVHNIDLQEQVDFAKYSVLVVVDSLQPTLGYSLNLLDYKLLNTGKVFIEVQRLIPSSACIQAQIITRPFVIASVERTEDKETNISIKETEYNPCR